MEAKSFKELFMVLRNKNCFKEIVEHSEEIKRLLNIEGIDSQCVNLERCLREFKLMNHFPWSPTSGSSEVIPNTRDDILHRLSVLWEIYHVLVTKRKEDLCPSLYNFCRLLCGNDLILQMLVRCLKTDDHFINFQAHKVLLEIVRRFPEIVTHIAFQKLISTCLNDEKENGRWTVLYTFKIIKEIITLMTDLTNLDFKLKRSQNHLRNCDCKFREASPAMTNKDLERLWNILYKYSWDLIHQYLGRLTLVFEDSKSETNQNSQYGFQVLEQTLASFLSLLSELMKPCFHQGRVEIHQPDYFEGTCHASLDHTHVSATDSESGSEPRLCSFIKNHEGSWYKVAEISNHKLAPECSLSIMKCIQTTVEMLVEIYKRKEFSLHLRRNIIQFFNDVVGNDHQYSSVFLQTELEHDLQTSLVSVCSFLLGNADKLLEGVPKVRPGIHFGGEDVRVFFSPEADSDNLVYDQVITRKVLLLILKLVMGSLQVEKRTKSPEWNFLIDALESWQRFIGLAIQEPCERFSCNDTEKVAASLILLFCDQDDELMTVLLYLLDLYQELLLNESLFPVTEQIKSVFSNLNPHRFYLEFLRSIHYDHSLLLDFLISNETCFLQYFSSYLRHLANDWYGFLETVKELDFFTHHGFQKLATEGGDKNEKNVFGKEDNGHLIDFPVCSQVRLENYDTGKTSISEKRRAAFQDSGYKSQNDTTFLELDPKLELSAENDINRHKNVKEMKVNVAFPTHSALWSLKNDYGDQSSSDGDSEHEECYFSGTACRDGVCEMDCKDNHANNFNSRCYGDSHGGHYGDNVSDYSRDYDHSFDDVDGHSGDHEDYRNDKDDDHHYDGHNNDYRKDEETDHNDDVHDENHDCIGCHGDKDDDYHDDGDNNDHDDCWKADLDDDHDNDDVDNCNDYHNVNDDEYIAENKNNDNDISNGYCGKHNVCHLEDPNDEYYDDQGNNNCDNYSDNDSVHIDCIYYRDGDHDDFYTDNYDHNDCDVDDDDDNDHNYRASDVMNSDLSITDTTYSDQDGVFSQSSLHEGLHKPLSCLIRLRFSIQRMTTKRLFPYPVEALVRVIRYIESLYEGE